jgi:hypothetical protein
MDGFAARCEAQAVPRLSPVCNDEGLCPCGLALWKLLWAEPDQGRSPIFGTPAYGGAKRRLTPGGEAISSVGGFSLWC